MTSTSIDARGLSSPAVAEIADTLSLLLADVFTLYVKTKSFHWHVTGRHFRDDHLLLDEQAGQVLAMTDDIAERARTLGAPTLRSVGQIARQRRLADNDSPDLSATDMLRALLDDNVQLVAFLRSAHGVCDRHGDVATASLIETWIDESERRAWFLREITQSR